MSQDYLFTSESVSEGHPDKVADQISDAILDAILEQDPHARVAAETLCNTGLVVLAGEITTTANIDYISVARDTIKRIGYDNNNDVVADESIMITSDFNFVDVDFYLEYRVSDPVKAVYASKDPDIILQNIAQSCIRAAISNYDVDSVLTTGKGEIQSRIKEMITEQLDLYNVGLQLVNISIQDSEPPTAEVMEAFKAVETAKQGKETSINNANKYRNEKLPIAEADADQILQEAEATKQ